MNLIEQYTDALSLQMSLQSEEFQQQASLPIAERVLKGHSMINLTVDIEFFDGLPDDYCRPLPDGVSYIKAVHVFSQGNVSSFREGSTVVLSRGQYRFQLEVVQDSVRHFVLLPNQFQRQDCYLPTQGYPRHNWQADAAENTASFQMLQCVSAYLRENSEVESRINQLLSGEYQTADAPIDASLVLDNLNDSQQTAVRRALAADFIHLIQGPPGTGKTFTIARLCQQLLNQGSNVLISGPTHTAINNCLDHISRLLTDNSKVVKLGERYQAAEILSNIHITRKTRLPQSSYRRDSALSHEGIVIGATPYALCYPKSKKLDGWLFDYAIVDEASQMSIPMAVAVMSKCRRVIFVGDHQQLSPIIPSQVGNAMFECSIFQLLADRYPSRLTLLDVSYRLNARLLEVPNRLFYGGRLHSDVEILTPFAAMKGYTSHSQLLTTADSALLFLHDEFDGIGHSPYEAGVVSDLVSDLLNNGVPLHQIGILTPFRAQVREIRQAVYQRGVLDEQRVEQLFVDTVDRMQGQERDYVIYSMSDCNPMEHQDRLEFIFDYHRLNVAITRARVKTIVIANRKIFEVASDLLSAPPSPELIPGLQAFVDFYQQSHPLAFDPFDDSDIWL